MALPGHMAATLLFGLTALFAQGDGSVRGLVRDQTGAVVLAAVVDLVDDVGTVVATTATDSSGAFRFDGVRRAAYTLRARFEGFRPSSVSVRIGTRPPAPLVIVLELAAVTQELAVRAGDDVVAAAAAANRDVVGVTDADIRDMPVFDRGVVATLSRFLDASSLGSGGSALVVDGMEGRTVGVSPSAIQSIKVNQDPYSAELPRPGRGRIEVVTKAGADAYHGGCSAARWPTASTRRFSPPSNAANRICSSTRPAR